MPHSDKIHINSTLAQQLIATQFPQLADLPIKPVGPGGWDNRTFRLGEHMNIRLPSAAQYASKIEKEYHWLPKISTTTSSNNSNTISSWPANRGISFSLVYLSMD